MSKKQQIFIAAIVILVLANIVQFAESKTATSQENTNSEDLGDVSDDDLTF